jgi:uncharacterized protein (DUF2336 family)
MSCCFGVGKCVGSIGVIMTDVAASQGHFPVAAHAPNQAAASAGSALPHQTSVSAESFRKLTALLKKATPPDLGIALPVAAPVVIAPPVVVAPPHVLAPAAVIVAVQEIEAVSPPVIVAPAPVVTVVQEIEVALPPVEIVQPILPEPEPIVMVAAGIQPHITEIKPMEPIVAAQALVEIAPVAIAPVSIAPVAIVPQFENSVPAPEVIAPQIMAAAQVEWAEQAAAPIEIAPQVEIQAETPVELAPEIQVKPTQRAKPRDAFAVSPSALPPRSPAPVVQQTPEQEQEAADLARSLLDMMASGSSAGLPQERALAADTLLRMLPRLPVRSLISLSERVKLMEAPPTLLMAKLIADPNISVAGPLLEDCMHITDEDLTMVIGEGDFAKVRLIARRRHLSRAITNEVVKTGEDSVLLTLVRNLGAEIPQESFLMLAEYAKDYPDLLAPLCTRPDLPVPLAFGLFWLAPVPLRRYLLSRFLTDSETLTKILKITRVTDGEETAPLASNEDIIAALDAACAGDVDGASAAFAAFANINQATARRIFGDQSGEPMAAMLKAAGVARGQVVEIFEKLQRSAACLVDPERATDELQSTFDSLSFNKARILLTYWDWATLKTGPYAPLN